MLGKNQNYLNLIFGITLLILIISGIFYFKSTLLKTRLQSNISIPNINNIKPKPLITETSTKEENQTTTTSTKKESSLENFAKCLSEKGVELYVLATCPYCNLQEQMFGDSLKYLKVIECTENQDICAQKQIFSVPTWILPNGERLVGLQTFEALSQKTGCQF